MADLRTITKDWFPGVLTKNQLRTLCTEKIIDNVAEPNGHDDPCGLSAIDLHLTSECYEMKEGSIKPQRDRYNRFLKSDWKKEPNEDGLFELETSKPWVFKEQEVRFLIDDYEIVGHIDRINQKRSVITDYKFLGAWATKEYLDNNQDHYFQQLNLYRYGIKHMYNLSMDMELDVFIRDFGAASKRKGLQHAHYVILVPYIEDEKILDTARKNIVESLHEPRLCTKEESWGGRRCESFCSCYDCPQYKGIKYELKGE